MIPQKTYPEDYSCIIPPNGTIGGLYIGNLQAAQNINTLQKHSIKAVLTSAKGIELNHPKSLIPFMYYIPADDHESFNISVYFDKAADFIASALQKTNVMVHCLAGVSRSVSLVLSYFIKHKSFTFDEAFSLVKSKRRIIHPNEGFISQLKAYQFKLKTSGNRRSPQNQHHYSASPQKLSYNDQRTSEISQFRRSTTGTSLKKQYSLIQPVNQSVEAQVKGKDFDFSKQYLNRPYVDSKYEMLTKDKLGCSESFGRIKRLSSYNVPVAQYNERRQYDGIFSKIQNKANISKISSNISDIDKKIEQIRKKYREMSGLQPSYYNHKRLDQNRLSIENNYKERWTKEESKKKDYKYFKEYESVARNQPYQQSRTVSTHLYSRGQ